MNFRHAIIINNRTTACGRLGFSGKSSDLRKKSLKIFLEIASFYHGFEAFVNNQVHLPSSPTVIYRIAQVSSFIYLGQFPQWPFPHNKM